MGNQNSPSKKNVKKNNKLNKTEKKRCIYIVTSKTSTWPSHVIKMWTKEPYAHTSLAMDIELNEMYSFARKKLKNPFNCGFITEDITTGVFGRDKGTKCRVMRLWVTENQLKKIRKTVGKFKENKSFYGYNYLGIFGIAFFNKGIEREYNYFCSQFVYYVLSKADIKLFDKKPGLVRPEDFRTCKELEVIFEGKLNEYRDYLSNNFPKRPNSEKYVERRGINFEKYGGIVDDEVAVTAN